MLEWLKEPGFLGTHATVGADMSQFMATFFTGLFVIGWIQARKRRADAHHWMMLGGMIAVLAFEGKEGFGGSQALYDYVFIPVLTVHIILVILGLVMGIYMIVLGFRAQQVIDGVRSLKETLLLTTWRKVGLIFGTLTAVVMLLFFSRIATADFSMRKFEVYLGLLSLIAIVFSVEMTIQRIWPNGARRHRALGRFTMIVYCILFVTGTTTYTMLYILYPGKIG
jgi:uncharacterized membrane protein YozB (DUF420 family)